MYESRRHPLLPLGPFVVRIFYHLFAAFAIIGVSLGLGMIGYHHFESMTWVDSYVNAAMILSGMGPVSDLTTDPGKIFAGSYALFSGIIFLVVIALIIAPLAHRFLHKFLLKS